MKDLISVVVPVYNVETYISKCVTTLVNQTYKNLEIILVDDGSTDKSGILCDEFVKKYDFVRVIHKTNGGLSDARNVGIKTSNAEYIVFVDSDDFVSERFIEILANGFDRENVDISCCAYLRFYDETEPKINLKNNDSVMILNNKEAMKFCYSKIGRNIDIVAWNKLYRKSLFLNNNIEYPKGKYFEDLYTTFKLFYYSKRIYITSIPLYFYRQRSGSIMSSTMSFSKYENLLDALKSPLVFYKKHSSKELFSLSFSMYCRVVIKQYYNAGKIKDKTEQVKVRDSLYNDYFKIYKENFKETKISLIRKIVFFLFKIKPNCISRIIK